MTIAVTSIYLALMESLDVRRCALGLTSVRLDERAGCALGHWQKGIHADAASGRQLIWPTLQLYADVLFPDGLRIRLVAEPPPVLEGPKRVQSWVRGRLVALGGDGGRARYAGMTADELAMHQKLAARARWNGTESST
jgi:hypothetical protein